MKLCLEDNRLDLALHHLRQQIRLMEAAGPRPLEAAEAFGARLRTLRSDEQALGLRVRELLSLTETTSFSFDAFGKGGAGALASGLAWAKMRPSDCCC